MTYYMASITRQPLPIRFFSSIIQALVDYQRSTIESIMAIFCLWPRNVVAIGLGLVSSLSTTRR